MDKKEEKQQSAKQKVCTIKLRIERIEPGQNPIKKYIKRLKADLLNRLLVHSSDDLSVAPPPGTGCARQKSGCVCTW